MTRRGGSWHGQAYTRVTPVWRHCAFLNCPRGLFVAHRADTRYCSVACRSNASAMRRGKSLRGTGITGGAAQKHYRAVAA